MSARGHQAVVEGIVEKIELTAEQAREQARMHAKEKGEPFDSMATFSAKTSYQLKGLGAIISE
jgi:DNA topoisomerase VI subunit A